MADRKTDTKKSTGKGKPATADKLVKTGKNAKIELTEDELKDVAGGIILQGGIKY